MARREKILVIEPEEGQRAALVESLAAEGYAVTGVPQADAALEALSATRFDLLVTEIFLPGLSGIEALKRARAADPDLEAILLARDAPTATIVAGMRAGAYDCLEKPVALERLRLAAEHALAKGRLARENAALRRRTDVQASAQAGPEIVGDSPATREVLRLIDVVAATDLTVLIQGESGTGKELVATRIHRSGARAAMPLVAINCGAIQPTLLESELFGHEKGAFTGAVSERPGLFEVADRGTLFLDEVGEMPLDLQVKLLRVIETSEFRRVGGQRVLRVDVRIIAATNRRLPEEVKRGAFREDLFYRLNVISIEVPPLRKRREEIPALVEAFCERARRRGMRRKTFTKEALEAMRSYAWPGNVRELENLVERALILSRGDEVRPQDMPEIARSAAPAPAPLSHEGEATPHGDDTEYTIAELERRHILRVLARNKGNKVRTARKLGVNVKTLYNKLKLYSIDEGAAPET